MQKKTKNQPAKNAPAGKSKQAGTRKRKPLTPEQRERKNALERARRARVRAVALAKPAKPAKKPIKPAKPTKPVKPAKPIKPVKPAKPSKPAVPAKRKKSCCGSPSKDCGGSCKMSCAPTPASVFGGIARELVEMMSAMGVPVDSLKPAREPVQEEPGVVRCDFDMPNGKAVLRIIDADGLHPLSRLSPIPAQVHRSMLLARMAREISDIVDRSVGMC